MTVYVDDMYQHPMGRFRGMRMSHMIADTLEELHQMAKAVGVAKRHFQSITSDPHYDLSMSKRSEAIARGAIAISLRTLSCMNFVRKVTGRLPKHTLAEIEWRRLQRKLYIATAKRSAELKMRDRSSRKFYAYKSRMRREQHLCNCSRQ